MSLTFLWAAQTHTPLPICRYGRVIHETETDAAIERLEELLANARPVPLTDQVRIDLRKAQLLVSEVRDSLSAERRSR